jgi:L-amino acid N-acyltransferase YncA
MDIAIREAHPDDAEAVVGILNPVIETGKYTVLDGPFSVEEERRFIASFPPRGIFHVAQRRPAGWLAFRPWSLSRPTPMCSIT